MSPMLKFDPACGKASRWKIADWECIGWYRECDEEFLHVMDYRILKMFT